jgi:hypothetical protein
VVLATRFALAHMVKVAITQVPESPAHKEWLVPEVTLHASADVGHSAITQAPEGPAHKEWLAPQVTLHALAEVGHSAITQVPESPVMRLNRHAEGLGRIPGGNTVPGGNTASEHLFGRSDLALGHPRRDLFDVAEVVHAQLPPVARCLPDRAPPHRRRYP